MRKPEKIILLLIISTLLPLVGFSQIYTIGPTINWNLGNKQSKVSNSLEFGIIGIPIRYSNKIEPILSLELGMDFGKDRKRFYTDFRLTFTNKFPVLYGVSAGPLIEWGKDCKTALGFQSSVYGWCIVGANFRYRYVNRKSYFGPGLIIKFPFTFEKINYPG